MPFPSYRIDLTPVKEHNESSFVWPWQAPFIRNSLERRSDKLLWYDGVQDGVEVVARLWRILSNHLSNVYQSPSVVAAFPDASATMVRQWVDLAQWAMERDPDAFPIWIDYEHVEKAIPTVMISGTCATSKETERWDHDTITKRTKAWVKRVLVDLGICPFTKATTMSGQGLTDLGVPAGRIAYHTSSATASIELMADAWEAMDAMLKAGPNGRTGVSSILLAAPNYDDSFQEWAGPVFCLLENGVLVAQATDRLGVVCFHPKYLTPDGTSFPGFGHMHSVKRLNDWVQDPSLSETQIAAGGAWQRRTPHATINVLRADQLAAAEGKRSSPELYTENIKRLISIPNLQECLDQERNL